jgi:hypothetical protein
MTCKTDDMRDVANKKCICGNRVLFGIVDGKPTHCMTCKTDDMRDVANKKCICGKHPVFGIVDGKPTHCKMCKKNNMIDVVHKKCQCGKISSFGLVEGQPTHCMMCKEDDMEDVINKRCPGYNGETCTMVYRLLPGREYCPECDPDKSRSAYRKPDEAAFFNFLKKTDVKVTQEQYYIDFRCIDTDKTRAEIDGVIFTKDVVVCVELDEDAHESYPKSCEKTRMHNATAELKMSTQGLCVAWVRVNPHTKKNGKRNTSRDAKKIRDQRHREALVIIKDILQNPRDCVEFVGYEQSVIDYFTM